MKPKIAIVGRPNVGKSALFNRLCGRRIAIVDSEAGITRDRLYAEAEFFGNSVELIDTGGIAMDTKLPFQEEVMRQTKIAIEEADQIIMVVDAKAGMTELDTMIAKLLLKQNKPLCLAVNKVDSEAEALLIHQFHGLGIAHMIDVSAMQGLNIAELLELATVSNELTQERETKQESIKVAIVGRANVGKSTLLNFLVKQPRSVVSPTPGTTRDSVDVDLMVDDQRFTLIDTAGIRRKRAEHEVVDKFAALRTQDAIERSDVCILVLDALEGLTTQERRILSQIEEEGKGCILVFNKWDLVKGFRMEHCFKQLQEEASFVGYCPIIFASAKEGRKLDGLLPQAAAVHAQLTRRITTGELNRFVEKAVQSYHPPMIQGRRLRIFYLTQVGVFPPRFVLFVNKPSLMVESYQKYLINQFRKEYGFTGVPIIFKLKGKSVKSQVSSV